MTKNQTTALVVKTDKVYINADSNSANFIILGAVIVLCFFVYVKFGHKRVKSIIGKRKVHRK